MPLTCQLYATLQIIPCADRRQCNQSYNQEPWFTYIHISDVCPWTNKPATQHILLQHCYSIATIVYMLNTHYCKHESKTANCNFYLQTYCHMCQKPICSWNILYTIYEQISWHAWMGKVCQYIYHIWTHWHQPCDQSYCTQMTTMAPVTTQPNWISWVGQ